MATNTKIRNSKVVTKKEDIDYFLNLTQKQLESLSAIMNTFGTLNGKEPKFQTYDIITIPPGSYGNGKKKNKNAFITTLGRWWFNKCFIESDLFDLFGYINEPITNKKLGKMNKDISYAIIEDRIPVSALKRYLMRQQKFQPYCNILCSGFTENMLLMSKKIEPKKKELMKKYKNDLNDPNKAMYAADEMEKELLSYAKKELDGDISMDMYDSGSKGSFGNNFKNIFVMRGAVKDPDPSKGYFAITSNYIDGMNREDFPKNARSLAAGPYARSRETPKGGYWEKLFLRALQHIVLGPKGSDCKTTETITVTLTSDMEDLMMYSFIVEGNNLVELTSQNRDKYLNKTVKMRFSSLCKYKESGQICNACAGNLFYRLGYKNIGTAVPQIASTVKRIALKKFHDSTVNLHKIDIYKAFGINNHKG